MIDHLSYPIHQYPIVFIDYIWVVTIYISIAFILAVIIDGHILPPFDYDKESKNSSIELYIKVLLQFAVQGFIAILLSSILQKMSSPFDGIYGYHSHSSIGILIRNPAIIYIILITLSTSLKARILYLFSRFNKNTPEIGFKYPKKI
jgi:hypothetical protein